MRYASIRSMDISNGEEFGVALFVQGCHQHCFNCFNPESWDFNGGEEWTDEVKQNFLKLVDRPYIKRVTLLGGEPLTYENLPDVYDLVIEIKQKYPTKKIWLYTGYELDCGIDKNGELLGGFANADTGWDNGVLRNQIIRNCDVIVDGPYKDNLRDFHLKFRGSSNQRIIDVKETIKEKKIVLYELKGGSNENNTI